MTNLTVLKMIHHSAGSTDGTEIKNVIEIQQVVKAMIEDHLAPQNIFHGSPSERLSLRIVVIVPTRQLKNSQCNNITAISLHSCMSMQMHETFFTISNLACVQTKISLLYSKAPTHIFGMRG
jgi:hypothetical protein